MSARAASSTVLRGPEVGEVAALYVARTAADGRRMDDVGVTGGKLDVETDAKQAVANMMAWIHGKRDALGI